METKSLMSVLIVLAFVVFAQAETINVNPNFRKYQTAELLGGMQSSFYYSGVDTVAQPRLFDSTSYDTSLVTDLMEINWIADSTGSYPNWTLSDSLVKLNARSFWVWVELDTTTLKTTADSAWYGTKMTNADSVGIQQIFLEYFLEGDDDPAWYADTSNWVALDGAYNDSDYGVWLYEDKGALVGVPIAGQIGKWWIFNAKVPLCSTIRLNIQVPDNMREFTIIKWRVTCAH